MTPDQLPVNNSYYRPRTAGEILVPNGAVGAVGATDEKKKYLASLAMV
jgi:hypothetical protein